MLLWESIFSHWFIESIGFISSMYWTNPWLADVHTQNYRAEMAILLLVFRTALGQIFLFIFLIGTLFLLFVMRVLVYSLQHHFQFKGLILCKLQNICWIICCYYGFTTVEKSWFYVYILQVEVNTTANDEPRCFPAHLLIMFIRYLVFLAVFPIFSAMKFLPKVIPERTLVLGFFWFNSHLICYV